MDTVNLVRSSLEKQDTRFREAFPTEKRVATAFGISHLRCSMKKDLRPATLLKKGLWHRCFPVNFANFLRTFFLQNTSGRLLLSFMTLATGNSFHNASKTFAIGKLTMISIIGYRNILSNFREPHSQSNCNI